MELGEHLTHELGLLESSDTLARWMAHHVAELLQDAKSATTPNARRAAARVAADTILKIWERRTKLPGDAYPLARYREILAILDRMTGSTPRWARQGGSRAAQVIAALPEDYAVMLLGALLLEGNLEADPKYDELVDTFLDPPESKLFGGIRIVIQDFTAADAVADQVRVPVAERVRAKTLELLDRMVADLGTLRNSVALGSETSTDS